MAAVTKDLAPLALHFAQKYNSGSLYDKRVEKIAACLVEFYEILKRNTFALPDREKRHLASVTAGLCQIYKVLSDDFAESRRWKLIPKFHLLWHLGCHQAQSWGTPRYTWTYADEDQVGAMIEVAKSVHPRTMAATAMYKNLFFMFEA